MSTIASPRDPTLQLRRVPSSSQTPTSSARPSLESSRSAAGSPKPNSSMLATAAAAAAASSSSGSPTPAAVRRNRAALREYYHLKKSGGDSTLLLSPSRSGTPALEITEPDGGDGSYSNPMFANSEVPPSEMDRPGFEADAYVQKTLQTHDLAELLRAYTRVLGEIRALDAEKKGLVYDNYSRLITATETIRKMRANMDPLNPMAATLDPAVAHIYTQASALRQTLRQALPPPANSSEAEDATAARARSRQLAAAVLQTPDRLRQLLHSGRPDAAEEARRLWQRPRELLQAWRDAGLGGDDVAACLADGEAALRGEPRPEGWKPEALPTAAAAAFKAKATPKVASSTTFLPVPSVTPR